MRAAFFFQLFLFSNSSRGQVQFAKRRTLSLEHGLNHTNVYSIIQDRRGFIWFGTRNGLNRYDGYTFTLYQHDPHNSTSLSENDISYIYQDRDGYLWVCTWGGGLNRFDPARENISTLSIRCGGLQDGRVQTPRMRRRSDRQT